MGGPDRDIKVAVVVVIEDGNAPSAAGLVQSDFWGDVGKANDGLFASDDNVHPVLLRDEAGVIPHLPRSEPEPIAGALVCRVGIQSIDPQLGGTAQPPGASHGYRRLVARAGVPTRALWDFEELGFGLLVEAALAENLPQLDPCLVVVRRGLQALFQTSDDFFVLEADKERQFGIHLVDVPDELLN